MIRRGADVGVASGSASPCARAAPAASVAASSERRTVARWRRVTGEGSVSDRIVEAELDAAVRRQRLGHALLGGQCETLEAETQPEVVVALQVELQGRLAVVLEALKVVRLEVELAADALADAALEAVGTDGEPQVEAREPEERVVDVRLHEVGERIARELARDVGARPVSSRNAVCVRSSPSSVDRSICASRSGPWIRMRTLWSAPFASVTMLVAWMSSSGVSPSAMDFVSTKVTWFAFATRSKSPRMPGKLKRPSVGRTSPAIAGSDRVPPTCRRTSTWISGARLFCTTKPSPTVRTVRSSASPSSSGLPP